MIFFGIDPGIRGALAMIDQSGRACVHDLPHHASEHRLDGFALARLMRSLAPADEEVRVFLEKLHAVAGHGGGGAGMQQMGAMMKAVGIILGAVDCTRFPLQEVTPQTWKKFYGLIDKPAPGVAKKTASERKAMSLDLARRLFPDLQVGLARAKDDGRAEALLLAHYGHAVSMGSYSLNDEAGAF